MINRARNSWLFIEFISLCILHILYGEYMQKEPIFHWKSMRLLFLLHLLLDKCKITYNNHVNIDWQCQKQLVGCWVHFLVYFACMQWMHAKWAYFIEYQLFLGPFLDKCKMTYNNHVKMIDSTRNSWLVVQFISWCILHVCSENTCKMSIFHWKSMRFHFSCTFCLTSANNIQQPSKQLLKVPETAGWLLLEHFLVYFALMHWICANWAYFVENQWNFTCSCAFCFTDAK